MIFQISLLEDHNFDLTAKNETLHEELSQLKSTIEVKASGSGVPMTKADHESTFERDPKGLSSTDEAMKKPKYSLQLTKEEVVILETYFLKFIEKLFKIYNKVNVKVISLKVLEQELSPLNGKPLLSLLDSLSGNLNKVSNHISMLLKENDNEVA